MIVLLFVLYLANKKILPNVKTKKIINITIIAIAFICLEISILILSETTNSKTHILSNALNSIFSPVILLSLSFLFDESLCKYRKYIFIPFYIQVAIYAIYIWLGWISIHIDNEYIIYLFFLLNIFVILYSLVILVYALFRSSKEYETNQKIYLTILCMPVYIGSIIQIVFQNILCLGVSVSISLMFYYTFLLEEQVKLDPLTGILNRWSFDKNIAEIQKLNAVIIVVLDLNNLKMINDTWGHIVGDNCLVEAANLIKLSFEGIGITYRIGGDEFCVLCRSSQESRLTEAFNKLESLIANRRNNLHIPLEIAFGYEVYNKTKSGNIYDSFTKADLAMYTHKSLMKNQ